MKSFRNELQISDSKWKSLGKKTLQPVGPTTPKENPRRYSPRINQYQDRTDEHFKLYFKSRNDKGSKITQHDKIKMGEKTYREESVGISEIQFNQTVNRSKISSYSYTARPTLTFARDQISRIFQGSQLNLKDSESRRDLLCMFESCKEIIDNFSVPQQKVKQYRAEFSDFKENILKELERMKLFVGEIFEILTQRYQIQISHLKREKGKVQLRECGNLKAKQKSQLLMRIPQIFDDYGLGKECPVSVDSTEKQKNIFSKKNAKENRISINLGIESELKEKLEIVKKQVLRSNSLTTNSINFSVFNPKRSEKDKPDNNTDNFKLSLNSPRETQKLRRAQSFEKIFQTIEGLKESIGSGQFEHEKGHQKKLSEFTEKIQKSPQQKPILKKGSSRYENVKFKTEHCL